MPTLDRAPGLKRRRCQNCPKIFQPNRAWQVFCSASCRKQYHEHGGAYVKLRGLVENLIERRLHEVQHDLERSWSKRESDLLSRASTAARAETLRVLQARAEPR